MIEDRSSRVRPGSSCVNQVMTPASPPEAHDGIRNLTALVPCRQVLGLQDGPTIVAGHSYATTQYALSASGDIQRR